MPPSKPVRQRSLGGEPDLAHRAGQPGARDGTDLAGLAALAQDRSGDAIERVLAAAREQLGMDVAFVGQFSGESEVFHAVEGDAGSFGFERGTEIPLKDSYCQRMVDGHLPNLIPDAKRDKLVKDLRVTHEADIGAYVGVPIHFSDGCLYGVLCCESHGAEPALEERDVKFMHVLARLVGEELERQELEQRAWRLEIEATGVNALMSALDARDLYTGQHSKAVVELSTAVARRLGLTEAEVAVIGQVALLHDIGKIGVPDSLLKKPGELDAREWESMRRHPEIGERLVATIPDLSHLAPLVRAEHERWDGRGYPDGRAGEQIPLPSRIVFACDSYHAMISKRPYRDALSPARAAAELRSNAGHQFDPHVVVALTEELGV